jgi:hypothetical protein
VSSAPHDTRDSSPTDSLLQGVGGAPSVLALVLVWSRDELERIGELVLLPPIAGTYIVGRGGELAARQVLGEFIRQRPGHSERTGPLLSTLLSRSHLAIRGEHDALEITNVGRAPLLINGRVCDVGRVAPGDLVEGERRALFLCVRRPPLLPAFAVAPEQVPPAFGDADGFGIVGESAAAWELRRELAFAAGRDAHVLLVGPSGSGKECAVLALHALSPRRDAPLLSRNAATIPEALLDAELFGHARDYPNAGMPARNGLIGEADGGTVFLDEIGELPHDAQAHLLRVMDRGEYQRLGEARPRRARVRVIAATNRDPEALKHDLLARFPIRIRVPGLARGARTCRCSPATSCGRSRARTIASGSGSSARATAAPAIRGSHPGSCAGCCPVATTPTPASCSSCCGDRCAPRPTAPTSSSRRRT